MPESAEVRQITQNLSAGVTGKTIFRAEVLSGRYARSPISVLDKLRGFSISAVACKGKLIFFQLKHTENALMPKLYILSTLGMTGYWEELVPHQISPKHARIKLALDTPNKNGPVHCSYFCFTDQRNFGTFRVVNRAGFTKKIEELGPDVAQHLEVPDGFMERLERYGKNKTIAEVMLDQRVFCGVGNYMRADAMYIAKVDPRTPALDVPRQFLGMLWTNAHVISNAAFDDRGVGNTNVHFYNLCYGRQQDDHGNPIERFEDRNGRTVWWCPARQQHK